MYGVRIGMRGDGVMVAVILSSKVPIVLVKQGKKQMRQVFYGDYVQKRCKNITFSPPHTYV